MLGIEIEIEIEIEIRIEIEIEIERDGATAIKTDRANERTRDRVSEWGPE